MWRKVGGALLAASAVLVSPCCLPITLPVALIALGGTSLGVWMVTHQAMIAVVGTVYFVVALAAGVWWLLSARQVSSGVRNPLSLLRLYHRMRMTSSTGATDAMDRATISKATTCSVDGSCDAECCAPFVQLQQETADNA